MNTALYMRVSDPARQEQSVENQRRELVDYARTRNWRITAEYVDLASGKKGSDRQQLQQLLIDVGNGPDFSTVLVWKIDRFGRSISECLNNLEILGQHRVRFIAVTQGIDTDEQSPGAQLYLHMLAAFAEFERTLIRERVIAGIARAKAQGKKFGRAPISVDAKALEILRRGGLSMSEIGDVFKISASTVFRRLDAAGLRDVAVDPELAEPEVDEAEVEAEVQRRLGLAEDGDETESESGIPTATGTATGTAA